MPPIGGFDGIGCWKRQQQVAVEYPKEVIYRRGFCHSMSQITDCVSGDRCHDDKSGRRASDKWGRGLTDLCLVGKPKPL